VTVGIPPPSRNHRTPTAADTPASRKLQQKISGCWRTSEGAKRFLALAIRSYLQTATKHGLRPFEVLAKLTAGQPWLPATASP
jgi:hypothetical protein